jgi:hypothetical protein
MASIPLKTEVEAVEGLVGSGASVCAVGVVVPHALIVMKIIRLAASIVLFREIAAHRLQIDIA